MVRRRKFALVLASVAVAAGSVAIAGCGGDDDDSGDSASLSGDILIDGSSTVAPLTSAAAEAFAGENPDVNITVGTSGTGGGFEVFCAGETAISDASRSIDDDEIAACEAAGIEYTEVRVASDGIVNITSAGAVDKIGGELNLTIDQLAAIWGPDSTIDNWDQIPEGGFNSVPLTLAGPGSQSGTYDFFNEEVLGEDDAGETIEPRQDYQASEDDNVTVRAVEGAEAGLGYFGFSYYEENIDQLAAFSVDGVEPSAETITDGSYPLSRPLFIYVNNEDLERPEVQAFVEYYVENATQIATDARFIPAPQEALDEALAAVKAAEGGGTSTGG